MPGALQDKDKLHFGCSPKERHPEYMRPQELTGTPNGSNLINFIKLLPELDAENHAEI